MSQHNFVSFAGIFLLIGLAWLLSSHRRRMNWRVIGWGVVLQLLFGLFVFLVPAGTRLFLFLNNVILAILKPAAKGAEFVFGPLALPPGSPGSMGFFLAFQALPAIIFFSALMSILYFYGVMPLIIRGFAWVFTKLMRISGAESLCAASNIFFGIESTFTIRPHVNEMTKSELCTVLAAGMATVASNVMALYVFMLKAQFPTIAGHLMSASLLSAPAALVMSKILLPETESPRTLGQSIRPHYEREGNVFEAIINGAQAGGKVIVGIVALLIAVLGLVALIDAGLGALGVKLNAIMGVRMDWSLTGMLSVIFYPLTIILGVPAPDAWTVARIIGERMVLTEVASYQDLAAAITAGTISSGRSIIITTYALCGFAHFASMAIFVGGVSVLAPAKTRVLSAIGFRALIAATLACLMTACVAGVFYCGNSVLLGR